MSRAAEELQFYHLFDITHIDQVYLRFKAKIQKLDFLTTAQSIDVRLSAEKHISWSILLFQSL